MGVTILEAGAVPVGAGVPAGASEAADGPSGPAAPAPSAVLVQAAASTGACTGPSGKTYAFKRLTPLDRMLTAKALGGELMANPVYVSYAFVAASVTSVDGKPMPMPKNEVQIEARVQRIGADWETLNEAMRVAFAPPRPAKGEAVDGGEEDLEDADAGA